MNGNWSFLLVHKFPLWIFLSLEGQGIKQMKQNIEGCSLRKFQITFGSDISEPFIELSLKYIKD
jgi:hypothetical protein